MPARETVAGEATERSSTSKSSETCAGMEIRSPLRSVSSLLSSSSVFIDSIHSVSTGPSKSTHFWSSPSSRQMVRMSLASTPSDHSCVAASNEPYSSSLESDSGLMVCTVTRSYSPCAPRFLSSAIARVRHFHASDLPAPVLPTIMLPCRATLQSKICTILVIQSGTICRPAALTWASSSARSSALPASLSSSPGKRSESSAWNSGRSAYTSLGLMRSSIVRYIMKSSATSGSARLSAPAARAIGMTNERRP